MGHGRRLVPAGAGDGNEGLRRGERTPTPGDGIKLLLKGRRDDAVMTFGRPGRRASPDGETTRTRAGRLPAAERFKGREQSAWNWKETARCHFARHSVPVNQRIKTLM